MKVKESFERAALFFERNFSYYFYFHRNNVMLTVMIKYSILIVLGVFYLIYTIRFTFVFSKNTFFSKGRKAFHYVMIWLFPFVWISILKMLFKPIPGSDKFEDKSEPVSFNDNMESTAKWVDPSSMSR